MSPQASDGESRLNSFALLPAPSEKAIGERNDGVRPYGVRISAPSDSWLRRSAARQGSEETRDCNELFTGSWQ